MKSININKQLPLALGQITSTLLIATLLAALPLSGRAGGRDNHNPGIFPPRSEPFGRSYGEWGDAWVRWAYSFPADQNPITDTTGQYAAVGQSGPVWFLAGTAGGAAERSIKVPEGKALFFPVAEWTWINMPAYGDNPWSRAQEAYTRGVIAGFVDDYVNLSCQIDGREVNLDDYRFQTPRGHAYMVTLPDNNLWGVAAGTYGPSVDDGYWLMLAPLSHGHHTIHFTAAQGSLFSWSLDVTYHITVGDHH